jgi:ubiquinone/menaquinone biosynthesis C-methylase UbiE
MRSRVLPWACEGVELGDDVLELGPGYGITTEWLAGHHGRISAVEVDPTLAAGVQRKLGDRVAVHTGSATELPFPDASFDTVVCFTMLHHVPSAQQQDQLFAEAARVLRPGGVFAGSDSTSSVPFRLLHLGDTMVVVNPDTLPGRLQAAGLTDPRIQVSDHTQRFRARRPAA